MRRNKKPTRMDLDQQSGILAAVAVVIILFLFAFQALHAAPVEIKNVTVHQTVVAEEIPEKKINLNTATQEELRSLSGIGEVLSARILEYREENGPFEDIYQLMEVEGISQSLFQKLRNFIEV